MVWSASYTPVLYSSPAVITPAPVAAVRSPTFFKQNVTKYLSYSDGLSLRGGLGMTPTNGGRMQRTPNGVTINEKADSLDLSVTQKQARLRRVFIVEGEDDPLAAVTLGPLPGEPYAPAPALRVHQKSWKVVSVDDNSKAIKVVCDYVAEAPDFNGPEEETSGEDTDDYALNIGSKSVHVVRGIPVPHHWPPDGELQDATANLLIGPFDKDGAPRGVNIQEPVHQWEETHVRDTFRRGYRRTLSDAAQKLNLNSFRGWATGEVRLAGARVRRRADLRWNVTLSFVVIRNPELTVKYFDVINGQESTAQIGPGGRVAFGHDYIWMDTGLVKKTPEDFYGTSRGELLAEEILVTATRGVHVSPVYDVFDFMALFDAEMPFRTVM